MHFRRDWSTPQDIGWRCLAVNVSDVAAMGGVPLGAVVALSLPETLPVAFVEAMYDGMSAMAEAYDCPIIGGNISKATERLSVTITVLGSTPRDGAMYRASARAGDDIWVTGDLGAAKAGPGSPGSIRRRWPGCLRTRCCHVIAVPSPGCGNPSFCVNMVRAA